MSDPNRLPTWLVLIFALAPAALWSAEPDAKTKSATQTETAKKELFVGKVLWLRDALAKKGIKTRPEMDEQAALVTQTGEIIPLVADWRGRAFFQDERLRNRKVELVGIRKAGSPYLQVLMVYVFDKQNRRQYTDYWCDICSIPMYEIKECECCQGPIRLRFQHKTLPDYLDALTHPKTTTTDPPASKAP